LRIKKFPCEAAHTRFASNAISFSCHLLLDGFKTTYKESGDEVEIFRIRSARIDLLNGRYGGATGGTARSGARRPGAASKADTETGKHVQL